MKFGPLATARAEGATLAHALMLPGGRLKKGHVLTKADLDNITAADIAQLVVAQLEADDVAENEAARRVSDLLLQGSQLLKPAQAFTGRVNIYAQEKGVFVANAQRVNAVNAIHPAITLATLPDDTFVETGRMVATVKIIPFAVDETHLNELERVTSPEGFQALDLMPVRALKVGLIATELPSLKPSVMDKTARLLADRLANFDSAIVFEKRVAHATETLSEAVKTSINACDLLIIFGASAITDRRDTIPAAIEQAGGEISAFGMPVDPGNLLLAARLANKTIIGAPGCARSPAENGFDRVLAWVHADDGPVEAHRIAKLGVGGLLMEIHDRPQPREG